MRAERPFGVSALALLYFVTGILGLLAFAFIFEVVVPAVSSASLSNGLCYSIPDNSLCLLLAGAIIAVILGLLSLNLILAWGLWTGRNFARLLVIIFSGINIAIGIALLLITGLLAFISIIIYLGVIYYLRRPHVKEFFTQQHSRRPQRRTYNC